MWKMTKEKRRQQMIQQGICYLCEERKIETGGYGLCFPCYEEYIAANR